MAKQQTLSQSDVEIEQSPMHLLHRVGQCATDVFQAEMAGADLTARQFAVLASIARREGASQTDLVDMTCHCSQDVYYRGCSTSADVSRCACLCCEADRRGS